MMRTTGRGWALVALLAWLVMGARPASADALAEADTRFTYRGKPIHPGLVRLFETSLADRGTPVSVSVDIAAAFDTNDYPSDSVTTRDQVVTVKREEGYFAYRHIGRLPNGVHVLQAFSNGGGTGIFETLYLVRLSRGTGHDADGKPYQRLLMTIQQFYPLGDRTKVTFKLVGNTVRMKLAPFPSGKEATAQVDASRL